MHRMTGYDAQFIYDESPNEPQHTLKILMMSAEASREYSFEDAKEKMGSVVARLAPLRWRAQRVPLDLYHPVWVETPLDLDHHVRRLAIPAPAGHRELCETISEIASVPLDPDKPLWECWFLEGYEGHKVVSVMKVSHAVADGGATKELLDAAFATSEVTSLEHPVPRPPSTFTLIWQAVRDACVDLFVGLPKLIRTAARAARRRRAEPPYVGDRPPNPFSAPRGAFGGRLSRRRAFEFASVSLTEARDIRATFGVKLNDVMLATGAGAARRYLARHGKLPEEPLLGAIPASTRTEAQRGTLGNRVTSQFLWLPTHLEDPVARLGAAHEAALDAKRRIEREGDVHPETWMEILPPFVLKLLSVLMRFATGVVSGAGVIIVSSVVGPREPFEAGSGIVENFVSVGHIKWVAGLNVTVWSYADKLNFALFADREAVPDLWEIADDVNASFQELVEAADERRARVA